MIENNADTPAGWLLLSSRSDDEPGARQVVFEAHLSCLSDLPLASPSSSAPQREPDGHSRARAACAGYALRQYLAGGETRQ